MGVNPNLYIRAYCPHRSIVPPRVNIHTACPREVILVQLLARVSAVAPTVSLCLCPLSDVRSVCPPPVCPSRHQALPSGIGPFLERSTDILRRPPALAADDSHACRFFFFALLDRVNPSSTSVYIYVYVYIYIYMYIYIYIYIYVYVYTHIYISGNSRRLPLERTSLDLG